MPSRLAARADRLIEACWLMIAALIPLFFDVFSSRVFEPDKLTAFRMIMVVMLAAWAVRELEQPAGIGNRWLAGLRANPLALPALVLAGSYLISTIFSVQPLTSIFGSYQRLQGSLNNWLYIALFFVVAAGLTSWGRVGRLVTTIIATSVPVAFYGWVQHFGKDPLPWGGDVQTRVAGSMGNSIFLGAYLILTVPFTASRLLTNLHKLVTEPATRSNGRLIGMTGLYSAILLLNLIAIYWTGSRGPWLGLVAGAFVFCLFWAFAARKWRLMAVAGGVLAAFAAFLIILNAPNSPLAPLRSTYLFERLGTITDTESGTNRVRLLIWFGDSVGKGAAGMITDTPFRAIVGYGPETMYVAYNRFYPPELASLESRNATPDRSHNDLLDFLVTNGAIGLFAYLFVVVSFFSLGVRLVRQAAPGAQRFIVLAVIAAVTAHVVEAFLGIAIAATRTHVWMFFGIAAALPRLFAPVEVAEAAPVGAEKNPKRGRDRRPRVMPKAAVAGYSPMQALPVVVWLLVSILLGVLMLQPNAPILQRFGPDDIASYLVFGGMFWAWLGLALFAYALPSPPSGGRFSTNNAVWLTLPVVAIVALGSAISFANPVIADIHFKRAQTLDAQQRYDLSIPAYTRALEAAPAEDFYLLFLGRAYLEQAKQAKDGPLLKPLNSLRDLQTLPPLATLTKETDYTASLVALDQAYALNPLNTDHAANLGRLYRFWGETTADPAKRQERFAESDKAYAQALALSPNAAHLWTEWGITKENQGLPDEARAKYEYAITIDRRYPDSYGRLGNLLMSQANAKLTAGDTAGANILFDQAATFFQQVASADPRNAGAYSALGFIYHSQGRKQEAIEANEKVKALAPNDLATRRNLSILYRDVGNTTKALEEARFALNIAPNDQKPQYTQLIREIEARP